MPNTITLTKKITKCQPLRFWAKFIETPDTYLLLELRALSNVKTHVAASRRPLCPFLCQDVYAQLRAIFN